ncbi:MAG: hypothetical protein IPM07_13415 [Anaerolineales bacterium]|nr:hypothetical protein [Anaerolineales bacterium]
MPLELKAIVKDAVAPTPGNAKVLIGLVRALPRLSPRLQSICATTPTPSKVAGIC